METDESGGAREPVDATLDWHRWGDQEGIYPEMVVSDRLRWNHGSS